MLVTGVATVYEMSEFFVVADRRGCDGMSDPGHQHSVSFVHHIAGTEYRLGKSAFALPWSDLSQGQRIQ